MTVLHDPWTETTPSQKAKLVKARMHFYFQEEGGRMLHHPRLMSRRPSGGPVVDDAQLRGHSAISALLADQYIDHVMASRGRQLIEVLFKTNTVDASIAPEDGGLIFYWAALDMAITIQIFPSSGYWWSVRNIAGTSYSDAGSDLPLLNLRYSLNQFSKEVELQNPNWRSIVR